MSLKGPNGDSTGPARPDIGDMTTNTTTTSTSITNTTTTGTTTTNTTTTGTTTRGTTTTDTTTTARSKGTTTRFENTKPYHEGSHHEMKFTTKPDNETHDEPMNQPGEDWWYPEDDYPYASSTSTIVLSIPTFILAMFNK